jgi:hypothetical protein
VGWIVKVKLLIAAMLLGSVGPTNASDPLEIYVSPSVAFAPANLIVRTVIEANADNRALEIIADSENMYRSTEIPLNGNSAPRITEIRLGQLPSGAYNVRAVLRGPDRQERGYAAADVNVIESGNVR